MNKFDYSLHYRRWHNDDPAHHAEMHRWKAEVIGRYLKAPLNSKVLDVGCGFGFALGGLRLLGYQNIQGVEQSPQQAAACRSAGFDVDVTDDTIAWLHARPQSYDVVVLFDVLEHVPVTIQIDFLRAIYAAMRPGGKLLLAVPNANSVLAARWRYIDYTHLSSFTEHSLSFVLENAGFSEVWLDNSKGIGRFPRWAWRRRYWPELRKWLVRWCWLQVFLAEQPNEPIENISFELNLTALATKGAPD